MTLRLVVHIGLEKTGTTSLQRYCHDHRRALLARGLLYPRSNSGLARNHSPLVAAYIAHRPQGPTVALRWRPRDAAVAALAVELDASPAATALVSSEHFATHFDRSEAEQLAEDLGRFAPTIVVVVRDAHARFLSAYNTHVTAGGSLPIEAYAHAMLVPGTRFMSASRTLAIWEAAVGRERVRVIDYDAEPDMTAAVLRACGVTMPPGAPYRDRASLAPAAIELLRRANAVLAARQPATGRAGLAAWAQHSLFSIRVRRRLARQADAGSRVWRLAAETLARLDTIAAEDRRWIADAYGLALRGADARRRIVVDADAETIDDAALQRRAEALVDRATRGLWAPSRVLAALCDRVRPPA